MVRRVTHFVLLLILAQFVTSLINNTVLENNDINRRGLKTRRNKDSSRSRSTSSKTSSVRGSSAGEDSASGTEAESLNVKFSSSSSSKSEETSDTDGLPKKKKQKKHRDPESSLERRGWRKWHRACTKCPDDQFVKWKDPGIKWICGAYQQARRSFKSECMMHFRNCQDGTMFTKIADNRCANGTQDGVHPYNTHFFYDYKVKMTDESTSTSESSSSSEHTSSVSDSIIEHNIPPFHFDRDT